MKEKFKVSVIVPVMNEEGNIPIISQKLIEVLDSYGDYEIFFIDDGSTDKTLSTIKNQKENNPRIKFISFTRNFGHQNALRAGLQYCNGDCAITIDGDLQHPVELIPEMIKKWKEGFKIVNTIRLNDPKTGFLKKTTSNFFYFMMNSFSDIVIEPGSADFRLLDREVVEILKNLKEIPLFFRGMVRWTGFPQTSIQYVPNERFWGKTKYSFKKMVNFALEGITSFSVKPLRLSTYLGITFSLLSFCYGIYALFIRFFSKEVIDGWTSLLVTITFLGGVQLIMIGILGEYIGKLFFAQKERPHFLIKEKNID